MKKSFKRKLNLIFGTLIFIFLLGSAFAVDWIFGIGFLIGFFIAVYNELAEKNPLIPLFLFGGALIVRVGLSFIPSILEAKDIVSLIFSLLILLVLIISGYILKKGKWKIWNFSISRVFRRFKSKTKGAKRRVKRALK